MAHKDICIKFEVDGRRFEAVGFLSDDETPVDGDEILRRIPNAINKEDTIFLYNHRNEEWPYELRSYYLITGCKSSPLFWMEYNTGVFYCIGYIGHRMEWDLEERPIGLLIELGRGALVLRRCA